MLPCKVQSLFMAPQGDVGISETPAGSSFSHPAKQEAVNHRNSGQNPAQQPFHGLLLRSTKSQTS